MSAEFNWWLLIVGLIAGGALTWLVLAESTRREREIGDEELAAEAAWIARSLHHEAIDGEVARDVLQAHRRYLGFPPPDALVDPDELSVADDPAADLGVPPPDDPRADLEVSADQPAPETFPGTDASS